MESPAAAEQLAALLAAAQQADAYAAAAQAPNTRRAYAADWRDFTRWCAQHARASLPATPDTLVLYLTLLAVDRKLSTIKRRLTAIAAAHRRAGHPPPTEDAQVRTLLRGIRRVKGSAQTAKAPVVIAVLRAMLDALPDGTAAARDRALLLLGFAGAFRRSELVALDLADLHATPDGFVVTLRASKTDPARAGMTKGIPYGSSPATCPVRAVQAWIAAAALRDGPLFRAVQRNGRVQPGRLNANTVARIVKRAAARAGFDPARFSGHSLRAGLATAAAQAGASEHSIMRQTGHTDLATLRRYIRDGALFRENAAARVGL